jgi:hypothetical protein
MTQEYSRLRYHERMNLHRLRSLLHLKKHDIEPALAPRKDGGSVAAKILGWGSLAVGVAALGVYVGREIRVRYKFNHRTPYDYYAHSADRAPAADYGIGI